MSVPDDWSAKNYAFFNLTSDRQVSWLFKMRFSVEVSKKPKAQSRNICARFKEWALVKGNEVPGYGIESEMFWCKGETLTPTQLFVVQYNYLKSFSWSQQSQFQTCREQF